MEITKQTAARIALEVIIVFALLIGLAIITVAFFPDSAAPVVEMIKAFLSVLAGAVSAFKSI